MVHLELPYLPSATDAKGSHTSTPVVAPPAPLFTKIYIDTMHMPLSGVCRWGALYEIITDNAAVFIKALDYLAKKYKIHYIRISGYNLKANGLVERPHFDVRQALVKAANGIESKWSQVTHSVFWAERVTVRKRMGCSPYFAAMGTHPLIPLDITEATYLQPPPDSVLSTTDLLTQQAIVLQHQEKDLAKLHTMVFTA
jgi:hypothetical protein